MCEAGSRANLPVLYSHSTIIPNPLRRIRSLLGRLVAESIRLSNDVIEGSPHYLLVSHNAMRFVRGEHIRRSVCGKSTGRLILSVFRTPGIPGGSKVY